MAENKVELQKIYIVGGKQNPKTISSFIDLKKIRAFNNGSFLKKNIRKTDFLYVNQHVFSNLKKSEKLFVNFYVNNRYLTTETAKQFYNNSKVFTTILRQTNGNKVENNFLKSIGCPYLFKKNPRCGHKCILHFLRHNYKPVIQGFTVSYEKYEPSYYSTVKTVNTRDHDCESEVNVLLWLHNNNYIDATPCCFEEILTIDEKSYPVIQCKWLKPKEEFLTYCLDTHDGIIFKNNEGMMSLIQILPTSYKYDFRIEKGLNIITKIL